MQADRYSRAVTWLKITLPLIAIGLLSTLFLLSRSVDPTASVPFADTEVRDRLLNRQITGPYFSGTTADGDQIDFIAETVTTPSGLTGANHAEDVFVTIDMASGTKITVNADRGLFDLAGDQSELEGDVVITTSLGYVLRSQELLARISQLDLTSPGTVTGTGLGGDLTAGSMRLSMGEDDAPAQLIFTNGVKLIYDPKQVKD
jgi:lipopolysaccharide export system protein LptC